MRRDENAGRRLRRRAWVAFVAAVGGFAALVLSSSPAPVGSEQGSAARSATGAILEVGSVVGVAQRDSDGMCVVAQPLSVEVEVSGAAAPEVVWEFNEACVAVVTEINWPDDANEMDMPNTGVPEEEQSDDSA